MSLEKFSILEVNLFRQSLPCRKKDSNEQRVILKELNKFINYHHFKMETFEAAFKLVKPNSMMASVDLRQAYYYVRIHEQDRKFL